MTSWSITITHDPAGTAGVLTLDDASNATRVESRTYQRTENYPATVVIQLNNEYSVDATNIMHADFAGWSAGTGAIALGDTLTYSMCPSSFSITTADGALAQYFSGYITDIQSPGPNLVQITARDLLYLYDNQYYSMTWAASRADWTVYPIEFLSTAPHIGKFCANGVQTTGAYPGPVFDVLTDDSVMTYGLDITSNGDTNVALEVGDKFAQPFYAEHDGVYAIGFFNAQTYSGPDPNIMRFSIQKDNGSNRPDGTELYGFEWDNSNTLADYYQPFYWENGYSGGVSPAADDPIFLTKGKKYWLVCEFHATDTTTPGTITMRRESDGEYLGGDTTPYCWLYDSSAGTWSALAGNACMWLLGGTYTAIPGSDYEYYYDGAEGNLVVNKFSGTMPMSDTGVIGFSSSAPGLSWNFWSQYTLRARCSYYYGHLDLDDVINNVAELESQLMFTDGDANIDLPIPVYRSHGKTLGDCLRELCDLYGYSYSGTYGQLTICAYESAGDHHIAWGRRRTLADTSAGTIADYTSPTSAKITNVNLVKTSAKRPASVRVIGKSPTGMPLIATRNDRALGATSYYTKSAMRNMQVVTDESLTTLEQVNARAYAELDALNHDVWEGTITVSGCFPQLFSLDAGFEGSGVIVSVTYDPLNLSVEKFKVTSIETDGYTTAISVTSKPRLQKNFVRDTNATIMRTDAFATDIDTSTTAHIYGFDDSAVADSTCHIELCSGITTPLTGHTRVAATQLTVPTGVTAYDTYVYYAVIEPDNGYGTIQRVYLYGAATGGAALAEYYIALEHAAGGEPYKWKNQRVIVELAVINGS